MLRIEIRDYEHFMEVWKFARKTDQAEQLAMEFANMMWAVTCGVDNLESKHGCKVKGTLIVQPDFAPHSFFWNRLFDVETMEETIQGLHGGLIYHGAHDGGGDGGSPTFSVNLTPQDGWSIHT